MSSLGVLIVFPIIKAGLFIRNNATLESAGGRGKSLRAIDT